MSECRIKKADGAGEPLTNASAPRRLCRLALESPRAVLAPSQADKGISPEASADLFVCRRRIVI
jgi:hypothetical protein